MKIKLDFITNSSSTCYIVLIPKNFNIADCISKLIKTDSYGDDLYDLYNNDEKNLPKLIEDVTKNISRLQMGEELWYDDTACFNTTVALVNQQDLIISGVDISGDMGGIINGVKMTHIEEIQKRFEENENKT